MTLEEQIEKLLINSVRQHDVARPKIIADKERAVAELTALVREEKKAALTSFKIRTGMLHIEDYPEPLTEKEIMQQIEALIAKTKEQPK